MNAKNSAEKYKMDLIDNVEMMKWDHHQLVKELTKKERKKNVEYFVQSRREQGKYFQDP